MCFEQILLHSRANGGVWPLGEVHAEKAPHISLVQFNAAVGSERLLHDFGDSTTFRSQSAFIRKQGDKFWYIGDRWSGQEYFSSSYVALEIQFDGDGNPYIEYTDEPELFN